MASITFDFKKTGYIPPENPITFNFRRTSFAILGGSSNNFVSIWADETASRSTFKLYAASTGTGAALSVVDLSTKILVDNYTTTHVGAFNEDLDQEAVADINIGSRG